MSIADEIQHSLHQLPNAEELCTLVETGQYDELLTLATQADKKREAQTAALWACWMGKNSLLDKLLRLGVDPNCSDDAGR